MRKPKAGPNAYTLLVRVIGPAINHPDWLRTLV